MNIFGIGMAVASLISVTISVAFVLAQLLIAKRNVTKTIIAKATLKQLGMTRRENVILQLLPIAHLNVVVTRMIMAMWGLCLLVQVVEAVMVDATSNEMKVCKKFSLCYCLLYRIIIIGYKSNKFSAIFLCILFFMKIYTGCFVGGYIGDGTTQGTCISGYVCHGNGECRPRG